MSKYFNSYHFFPEKEIKKILSEIELSLNGSGFMTKGPLVKEFEKKHSELVGCKYSIATNSCTTALEIVFQSIGLKNEDEVIVPVQTFFSTGSSVINSGGKVVFCDTDENFSLSFSNLKALITNKTKAVVIVHFAGLIQEDIFEIKKYLKERNIYLIEDCAHATGASYRGIMAGNFGDFGCHSFYSSKIITTGEGGMITTNEKNNYYSCKSISSIGIDIENNIEQFKRFGSNYRMSEIQGILGLSQLKNLNKFINHRNLIAKTYYDELNSLFKSGKIRFQIFDSENTLHVYWKFLVFINDKSINVEKLTDDLLNEGFSIMAPYKPLLHLQPAFKKMFSTYEGQFPICEEVSKYHVSLPIHLSIKKSDAEFIARKFKLHIEK